MSSRAASSAGASSSSCSWGTSAQQPVVLARLSSSRRLPTRVGCRHAPATPAAAAATTATTTLASGQWTSAPGIRRRIGHGQRGRAPAAVVDAPLGSSTQQAELQQGEAGSEEHQQLHSEHDWFSVETLASPQQLEQVARLRAEAYYEHEHSRFVESFKKQFVSQEVESLQKRTARTPAHKNAPLAECLVAVAHHANGEQQVVGCIDIRLPYTRTAVQPAGVPAEDPEGAYILNVVTHEDHRGQGVATALMLAAIRRALRVWGAKSLYTHVEADNEVAYRLYTRCGFREHSEQSKFQNAVSLGRLVLLFMTEAHVVSGPPSTP